MSSLQDRPETIIELSRRDLDDIIESAAKRGASQALAEVGLGESNAVEDVRELRSLLKSWREMRATALRTIVQTATTAFLGLLAAGLALKLGLFGGVPKP